MNRTRLPERLPDSVQPMVLSRHWPEKPSALRATTDLEAVQAWLGEFRDSPHTLRAYRREAERLLLWCAEYGRALATLSREDMMRYADFLIDPQPHAFWVGPRVRRCDPAWRPFTRPMTSAARRQALVILNAMFTYLVEAGYLQFNPQAIARTRTRGARDATPRRRALSQIAITYIMSAIEQEPGDTAKEVLARERLRFLFGFLYLLGPRLSEIANHSCGSFVMEAPGEWWWHVTGKGGVAARVPVMQDMLDVLSRYRVARGLAPLPEPNDRSPLVSALDHDRPITPNMIYRLVKRLLQVAANNLDASGYTQDAYQVGLASTHWLRHTAITHCADSGVELRYLQRTARHAHLQTTEIYLHTNDKEWRAALQYHRLPPGGTDKT